MPVSFSSPPRNLFLLGSSGADVVTNFFKSVDKSVSSEDVYIPDEIRYDETNERFNIAGTAQTVSGSTEVGWIERRDASTVSPDWSLIVQSTLSTTDTTLRAMEMDGNNLIVVGKSGSFPWIARYTNGGVIDWQTTSNTADVEYTGVTYDSNSIYYACGNTSVTGSAQAFVEKFDTNGNPGWGKSAIMLGRDVVLEKISANSRGEVIAVGYLEDDTAEKGYIVKIDTATGEILWDRTLERNISGSGGNSNDEISAANVRCTACYIDGNDLIYVVGSIDGINPVNNGVGEFVVKYSPEGNILWQRENNTDHYTNLDGAPNMIPFDVKSDTDTQQTVVLSVQDQGSFALNNSDIFISKYSRDGSLVFRRQISKSNDNLGAASLDADASFYYILFRDQQIAPISGEPDRYTFGKISTSGNGLGAFAYDDNSGTDVDYTIVSNAENKIGRLSDGSVRNDESDLITYPFTANKLVFDDLATPVSNKKRQMDSADSFEYSGSPAIRPADFQELNLLGNLYSGSGYWLDQSGKGNNGRPILTEPFFGAGSVTFDGTGDSISVGALLPTSTGTAFTVDMFWYSIDNTSQTCLWEQHNGGSGRTAYFIDGSGNAYLVTEGNVVGSFAYTNEVWYFTRITYTAGGAIEVFVDGVSRGTGTQTVGVDNANFVIGDRSGANESLNGYISNCRVVVGSALSGAEVPTAPLNVITGTELLTCQGDTIVDASDNNYTITVNGDAASTNDGPINDGIYWTWDGNRGKKIEVPTLTSEEIGTTFTAEAWFYSDNFASAPGDADNAYPRRILTTNRLTGSTKWCIGITNSGRLGFGGATGDEEADSLTKAIQTGVWYHVVVVHDSTSYSLYVDGELAATNNSSPIDATENALYLTVGGRPGQDDRAFSGRIGEVRIYLRALTAATVFQNYNATKSKYINEAPDTAPKIGPGIVTNNNLLLNYDFGNRATYDRTENLFPKSFEPGVGWSGAGPAASIITKNTTEVKAPDGSYTATKWEMTGTDPYFYHQGTLTAGKTYTMSIWVKAGTNMAGDVLQQRMGAGPYSTNANSTIPADGSWKRLTYTKTIGGSDETNVNIGWEPQTNPSGNPSSGDVIYVWGPQLEEASSAGRLITTYGSAITAPTTVKNLVSSSYTGTFDADAAGEAPEFNPNGYMVFGQKESIRFGSLDSLGFPTGSQSHTMTFEFWVQSNYEGTTIFAGVQNPDAQRYYFARLSGKWEFGWGNYSWESGYTGGTSTADRASVVTDTWTHYCLSITSGVAKLYINGAFTIEKTDTSVDFAADDFPIGAFLYGGTYNASYSVPNSIAEFRIYNTGLSATEVSQNFNATRGKYGV